MKALQLTTASVTAGLAAAFIGGALYGQEANIDSDRYLISGDVISIVGAVAGAVFVALTAALLYHAFRPQLRSATPKATR